MDYSVVVTSTTNVVFGENDSRNYKSVCCRVLAGGDSREEVARTAASAKTEEPQ